MRTWQFGSRCWVGSPRRQGVSTYRSDECLEVGVSVQSRAGMAAAAYRRILNESLDPWITSEPSLGRHHVNRSRGSGNITL